MTRVIDILNEIDYERPAARVKHPEIDYTEKGKTKKATAEGNIDEVIATLSGHTSGKFTKLARDFKRLKKYSELLKKRQAAANEKATMEVLKLFPEMDDALTKTVDTVSMILKVGKKETRTPAPTVNWEGYANALEQLVPELADKFAELKDAHTKVHDAVEVKPKLMTPKLKDDVQLGEAGMSSRISSWLNKAKRYFKTWLKSYNSKIDKIIAQLKADLAK